MFWPKVGFAKTDRYCSASSNLVLIAAAVAQAAGVSLHLE
jgi:hypothetical protein